MHSRRRDAILLIRRVDGDKPKAYGCHVCCPFLQIIMIQFQSLSRKINFICRKPVFRESHYF